MSAPATTAVLWACLVTTAAPSAPAGEKAKVVEEEPRTLVTCEGPVEMTRDEAGRTKLVLSGGVHVERGKLTARASVGELELGPGGEEPDMIYVEGDVAVDSPRFGAKAGAARFLRVRAPGKESPVGSAAPPGRGGEAPADDFTVTLERRRMRAIELRAGKVRVTCGGPVTWRESSREISVAGRLRAESGTFVLRADSGVVTLSPPRRKPPPEEDGSPSRPVDERPEKPSPPRKATGKTKEVKGIGGIERLELVGPVDVVTKIPARKAGAAAKEAAREGGVVRKARAARAVYTAADEVLLLTGDPPPEIESTGVVLTAPEIRIYLRENRIESPEGRMRAVVRPRRPDVQSTRPTGPPDEGPSPGEDE